jgi:hypothetical protein
MGSFVKRSKNPMTQTSTPKSMEEISTKVMRTRKEIELFKIMAIISLNMGNLNMEVNNPKKKLATREKKKAIL